MSDDDDDEMGMLIARAQGGDRAALEAVLGKIAPSIHRFGMRMCKNVSDAEDILQDTLVNVAQHLPTYAAKSSFSSWVFALTRSACARTRRGLKNRPHVSDDARIAAEPDRAPSPELQAVEQERATALGDALANLSNDHREVIVLRDMEGLSALETADALGISIDAVKSRLHRARDALRVALAPVREMERLATNTNTGCPDIVASWSKKLDGDLSEMDCAAMEKHIAGCATCRSACDALKWALVACQSTRTNVVPKDIQVRVKDAIRAIVAKS